MKKLLFSLIFLLVVSGLFAQQDIRPFGLRMPNFPLVADSSSGPWTHRAGFTMRYSGGCYVGTGTSWDQFFMVGDPLLITSLDVDTLTSHMATFEGSGNNTAWIAIVDTTVNLNRSTLNELVDTACVMIDNDEIYMTDDGGKIIKLDMTLGYISLSANGLDVAGTLEVNSFTEIVGDDGFIFFDPSTASESHWYAGPNHDAGGDNNDNYEWRQNVTPGSDVRAYITPTGNLRPIKLTADTLTDGTGTAIGGVLANWVQISGTAYGSDGSISDAELLTVDDLDDSLAVHLGRLDNIDDSLQVHLGRLDNVDDSLNVHLGRLDNIDDSLNVHLGRLDNVDDSLNVHLGRLDNVDDSLNVHLGRLDNVDDSLNVHLGRLDKPTADTMIVNNALLPDADDGADLGSNTLRFDKAFIKYRVIYDARVASYLADHEACGDVVIDTLGESVVYGDFLFNDGDGEYYQADATDSTEAPVIGMALESKNANEVGMILVYGWIRDDSWSWTVGNEYPIYLSETTGELTQAAPSGSETITHWVGYAVKPNMIYFTPKSFIKEE